MASPHDALGARFRRFAEAECRGSSPLYERLALSIAGDGELLALAAHAPPEQPAPNLFLAAVHFLLLEGAGVTPLARLYPSLVDEPCPPAAAAVAFREFCLAHGEAVRRLVTTRRVQTNEVGRCAYLLPAFGLVSRLAGERPLALIEIGTSAGLNLLWDRYGYRYGVEEAYGDAGSPVQLACQPRGDIHPPLPRRIPSVATRVGVDLRTIDVDDPREVLWLEALVWPEHRERARALRSAIAVARQHRPRLVAGDGLALLPGLLSATPAGAAPCVFHTHTVNQLAAEARARLSGLLEEQGHAREIYRVSAEWLGTPHPQLELAAWRGGRGEHRVLADCDPHGRWLAWRDPP